MNLNDRGGHALTLTAGTLAGVALARWLLRRPQTSFEGASVIITGGSRGLGLELARQFAEEGAHLSLLARDEEELERARRELTTRTDAVQVYACDVGDRQQAQAAVRAVLERRGRIDVLVNNAGVIQVGPVEHMEPADFEEALSVHTWGPLHLIQAVAPTMKEQGEGHIVNISSIGGLVAVPHLLPYVVSKFALTGLSDGMRSELAKDGIQVTTVCPGLMRTGSHVNAMFKGQHQNEFAWFALSGALPLFSTSAPDAARQILEACRRGSPRLIITLQARLLHALNALAPRFTARLLNLAGWLLPSAAPSNGEEPRPGWASRSSLAPSLLTWLADKSTFRNNELTGDEALTYWHGHEG